MKKKLLSLVLLFAVLGLGKSCKPEHYLITGIDFNTAKIFKSSSKKESIVFSCTSLVKDKLIFILSYETEYLYGFLNTIGSTCYALTVPKVFDNNIVKSTFSLAIDKPIIYKGNTIPSMTNLFKIEDIATEIEQYENNMAVCGKGADIVFEFSDEFMVNSSFEKNEYYEITFSCQTTDNKTLNKSIKIKFE